MLNEIYGSLKEMYESFFKEQQEIQIALQKSEPGDVENNNQYYYGKIDLLNTRIKTLSTILNFIDNNLYPEKNCECAEFNCFSKDVKYNKEDINKSHQILDIQEKERQRIARDLHDTSLQNLAHLVHKIELSSMYMDQDIIKAKLELAAVNKNLKSIIQEIRNTIFDLRPMIFDDLGLKDAFERLISKLKETSDFDIQFEIDDIECSSSLILMTIFRIVEECMNNAVKHSRGNKVIFILKNEGDRCSIKVEDNGQSFNCDEVLSIEERHFGLFILKERVDLLSGILNIDSRPGVGTTINIAFPLLNKF